MKSFREYLSPQKKWKEGILSLVPPLLFLSFFSTEIPLLSFLNFGIAKHSFVILFLALLIFTVVWVILSIAPKSQDQWWSVYEKLLLLFLPGAFILFLCLSFAEAEPMFFQLGLGLYVIFSGVFLFRRYVNVQNISVTQVSPRAWLREQGQMVIFFVFLFTCIFFLSGLHRLTEFAAVDEPLWLEGRIAKYWNNIGDQEWRKTSISDKPGITIALATGPGLLYKNFKEFDTLRYHVEPEGRQSALERFYMAFRFPLFAVITLLLPFFYFFAERLTGRNAALASYGFITTSPVLIGMSKIINPDALLWLLVPLSLLSYLVFLKKKSYRYLVMAGIFFGLALLTKYVANILLIFLFGLIFAQYVYSSQNEKNASADFPAYLRKSLTDLVWYLFVALATFYLLFPAVWIAPFKLIQSTLLSQAFVKVAPLFLGILVIVGIDQYFNRARVVSSILRIVDLAKLSVARAITVVFLGGLLFVFVNVWSGMPWMNFMELLESPKNIATQSNSEFLAGFLTNFYPFAFAVVPLALLGLLLGSFYLLRENFWEKDHFRFSFYFILFILLYYFGGTINGVASIVRYQIMLFPLAAVISGIALTEGASLVAERWKRPFEPLLPLILVIFFTGIFTLATTPFPLSYASSLLPKPYYTDLKDMGPGSYEIAQALNALPDAKNLVIWSDKDGVCKFFLGVCRRGFGASTLRATDYDYIVVSSARASRTERMMRRQILAHPSYLPVHTYYNRDNPSFTVLINGRPAHFVKAFAYPKQ